MSRHCQSQLFQTRTQVDTNAVLYFLRGTSTLVSEGRVEEGGGESHPVSCFHFSSPSLREEPLVKFSHSLGLSALSLFCKERYSCYFKATSSLISLPVWETSRGERDRLQLPCSHNSGAGSALQEARAAPFNHLLPRGGRFLARPMAGKSEDGNHVMHQHLADTAPYPPKYLEEL